MDEPLTPSVTQETPPVIDLLTASPSTADVITPILSSYQVEDKEGLDSLVLTFGDGVKKAVKLARKTLVLDTVSHH
jgi:hypothetical protein